MRFNSVLVLDDIVGSTPTLSTNRTPFLIFKIRTKGSKVNVNEPYRSCTAESKSKCTRCIMGRKIKASRQSCDNRVDAKL